MLCPGCSAEITLEPEEAFCPHCRYKIHATIEEMRAERAAQRTAEQSRAAVTRARKWLLFVAVTTLLWGMVQYFIGNSETKKQIAEAERSFAGVDPAERDALMKERIGMTWQEAVEHDIGQVRLLLAVNVALSLCYLALWWWAARNPLVASSIALLLLVTVIGTSAVLDPKSMAKGIIVKIIMIGALSAAISAAYKARRAAEQVPRAA